MNRGWELGFVLSVEQGNLSRFLEGSHSWSSALAWKASIVKAIAGPNPVPSAVLWVNI